MNNVNECCHECNTQKIDQTKDNCPVCNKGGISVSKVTVEHLVTDDYLKLVDGEQYKICMNADCSVVVFGKLEFPRVENKNSPPPGPDYCILECRIR